jgi:hypothetical protein
VTEPRTWSFRTGDWIGVLGPRTVVALPPAHKARVGALWEVIDDGAGFDEVLDALISGGLRELPGFVLVSSEDDRVRVVVRGAACVRLVTAEDVVRVEGDPSGASAWVERTVTGVHRTRIEVAAELDDADLLVAGGVVRLATAECPPAPPRPEVPVLTEPEPVPEPDLADGPATEAMPAVVPAPEHDGLTRSGGLHAAPPGEAAADGPALEPIPAVTPRPVARLVFSSGEDVLVDRVVLVGRAPEARHPTEAGEPRLVAVPSPHHEISSTHLEIRPGSGADHGTAVVTDLGSTNGTLLVQPGLPPEDLHPGVAVQLIPGAVVDLGDGVTVQVLDP